MRDPVREAAILLGREPWDSTRARLLEGEAVSVLLSPRRAQTDRSDVWITILVKAGRCDALDSAAITLAGDRGAHRGRLDARGRCVIRGVHDGRYRLDLCPIP